MVLLPGCTCCGSCKDVFPIRDLCAYSIEYNAFDSWAVRCPLIAPRPQWFPVPGYMFATPASPGRPPQYQAGYQLSGQYADIAVQELSSLDVFPSPFPFLRLYVDLGSSGSGSLAEQNRSQLDFYVGPVFNFSYDDCDNPCINYPPAWGAVVRLYERATLRQEGQIVSEYDATYVTGRTLIFDSATCNSTVVPDDTKMFCRQLVTQGNCSPCYDWHLPDETAFSISRDGVFVNGLVFAWDATQSVVTGAPTLSVPSPIFGLKVKKHESCCFTSCNPGVNLCCNPLP